VEYLPFIGKYLETGACVGYVYLYYWLVGWTLQRDLS
jgi:hypothetical protein